MRAFFGIGLVAGLLSIQIASANNCFDLASAILTQSKIEESGLRKKLGLALPMLSRSDRKRINSSLLEKGKSAQKVDIYELIKAFHTQQKAYDDLASQWGMSSEEVFEKVVLHGSDSLDTLLRKEVPSKEVIGELLTSTKLSRTEVFELWLTLRKESFDQVKEHFPKLQKSAELFQMEAITFIKRMDQSLFTPAEYYARVELLKTQKPLWKEPKRVLTALSKLHHYTVEAFSKNFDKYLNLSKDFKELKVLLREGKTGGEKAMIATKYALSLPPQKLRMLYSQILDSYAAAKTKLAKKIIQTRLINMPDFKKVVATSLIADNGSLVLMHGLKVGLEKMSSLMTDLGAFSVIEIILSMTTIKEAAFLEAFPHLLKNAQEAVTKVTAKEGKELLDNRNPMQRIGQFLSKILKKGKDETVVLAKDGASLGVQTSLISLLPVAVAHAATGMTGAHLLMETIMMSGLIGVFFSTSSNVRYQIVNRLLVPALRRSPKLAKNESLRTSLILSLSVINVAVGSYTWLWYKEKYENLRNREEP